MSYELLQCSITSNKFELTWSVSHQETDTVTVDDLAEKFIEIFGLYTIENVVNNAIKYEDMMYIVITDEYGNIQSIEFNPLSALDSKATSKLWDSLEQCLKEFYTFKNDEELSN